MDAKGDLDSEDTLILISINVHTVLAASAVKSSTNNVVNAVSNALGELHEGRGRLDFPSLVGQCVNLPARLELEVLAPAKQEVFSKYVCGNLLVKIQ